MNNSIYVNTVLSTKSFCSEKVVKMASLSKKVTQPIATMLN